MFPLHSEVIFPPTLLKVTGQYIAWTGFGPDLLESEHQATLMLYNRTKWSKPILQALGLTLMRKPLRMYWSLKEP